MRPEAVAAMLPCLDEQFANPSGSHAFARRARRRVDDARDVVASVVGCLPGEVVFTSGGTEADNHAVLGAVRRHGGRAVCPAAEHHAVLHAVEHVGGTVVGVGADGAVDLDGLAGALDASTTVVSVMAVNNEVGTICDLAAVSQVVRERAPGALVHTDAVQAVSWLDLRAIWPHVDLLSLSAHKFGGPKGVGVLVIRDGVVLEPLLFGGGQERDRRSGTQNVPGIVAAAEALRLTDRDRAVECEHIAALRDRLVAHLATNSSGVACTVEPTRSVPGILHLCVEQVESEALLFLLDQAGVCASAASACASGAMEPSHVLAAMGVGRERAKGALRLSLGHTTTQHDIDRAADVLIDAIVRLRR
jgi:cysteine desulfurase